MTTLKLLTLVAAAFAAPLLRAGTPEFFYQPASGLMSASLQYSQVTPVVTVDTSADGGGALATKITASSEFLIQIGYAFSENWACYTTFGHGEDNWVLRDSFGSISRKALGLTDLQLQLTNITPMGGWNLHAGFGLGISLDQRFDASTKPGTLASGGPSVINYLGLSSSIGTTYYYGLKVNYLTRMKRSGSTNTSSPIDYSLSGGNELSIDAFNELSLGGFSTDISIGSVSTEPVLQIYKNNTSINYGTLSYTRYVFGMQYEFPYAINFRVAYEHAQYGKWNYDAKVDGKHTQDTVTARIRREF